ncbi:30S ribosomal protein S8 [Candidatus Hydrogenosomobacter endosymbioticus]|uniref:Small ribosomal subunit protein uS8 n=1 Tax=Candidatus Hydrogenosomobacter endosymbioticus TaxID=2558174 RepID=A0ABM7V950_9PROT|nr:30S ribosomal protein S8 [Candidatus Hydrogenosomobacter endosymbioticus]BDB95996.1 30S ribosomal protein S8 [Candidatus Hydrogenosomobacter endosymbioticus]
MSFSDPIGDMITRIVNAQRAGHEFVVVPVSKMKESIANVLHKEGYVSSVSMGDDGRSLLIGLKYFNASPVIRYMKRVSKPSVRIYSGVKRLPRVANGLGNAVLTTSRGVMSDNDARNIGVGGEVLFYVA